ncbi:MAG TPA: DNA polymerase III subunit delta' [Vicinamibacterales bacterium]|nr:DNA polymerase III subunit delta' [Vicinamibacterales bacterium]
MPLRDIAGHRHLLALAAGAAVRGSLPPSLIFAGPEGVGKRLTAIALAQLLNCPAPVPFAPDDDRGSPSGAAEPLRDACGVCSSCVRIARGTHADVMMLAPGESGTIKIDQIREAIERSGYRPFEGRRRVVVVDDAEAMVVEAQNALLKTLEEPPASSVFVLVTSRPELLLPTVRSRCQRLRFGRLAPAEVAAVLLARHDYEPGNAQAAAASSDGSVGMALEGSSEEFVRAREAAAGLLEDAARTADPRRRLEGARALTTAGRAGADRDELARRLRSLAGLLRDLAALHARVAPRDLANADRADSLGRLLRAFDAGRVVKAFAAVDQALAALDRNASPKIVADWVALQL